MNRTDADTLSRREIVDRLKAVKAEMALLEATLRVFDDIKRVVQPASRLSATERSAKTAKPREGKLVQAIRLVLERAGGKAMKVANITEAVEALGTIPETKTKLRVRIGNEIYRDAKKKSRQFAKKGKGYVLAA